jgi:site-specific recombinase XerD
MELILMTEIPNLIETSFADAVAIIAAARELPEQTRRHWATSLRQIAKALDRPPAVIPARYSAVRADLAFLHQVPAGLTAKTLQNHKSNVKSALLWLAREKGVPEHGTPLAPAWGELRAKITDALVRWRLSSLMRFCSANGIAPMEVNEAVIERFVSYRVEIGKSADGAFRRLMARAWNTNVSKLSGWPARRLLEPPVKAAVDVTWEEFPEGLRRDVDQYLQGLTRVRRSRNGQRIRPLKASTIRTRRAELQAAARKAVKTGLPIEQLNSLSALLAPNVVEQIVDAFWQQNGDTPKAFTIDLAARFVAIARETKCLDDVACERLEEMCRDLEIHRDGGLTEKNLTLIRHVLTLGVWSRVVNLPQAMMAEACRLQPHSPIRAAVTAQLAIAIAILIVAPVRLANLTAIRIGTNLIKPGGPHSNYWLVFPDYDVKNRIRLNYPLEQYLTQLIDKYIFEFRPALLRGRNEDWLFPGQRGGAKQKVSFSGQITDRIYKATGLRMTVHQFRHAAGAIILKHRPGEYELVRQLLGHRNVQTTINAYIGLESIQASEIFGKIISEQISKNSLAAE